MQQNVENNSVHLEKEKKFELLKFIIILAHFKIVHLEIKISFDIQERKKLGPLAALESW